MIYEIVVHRYYENLGKEKSDVKKDKFERKIKKNALW